ncbi:hypothetical protein QTL86_17775 [Cellulosilyticum sp. ST5]|uniref:hypothetical protein n=1 Tax=Cellulosilyticum sp. ST5 TaxID=3055805 RepID=UPI0039776846
MFSNLSTQELEMIDGGGWLEAGLAFGGIVAIAAAPIVAVAVTGTAAVTVACVGAAAVISACGDRDIISY